MIIELCKKQPKNLDELYTMRGIKKSMSMDDCRAVLKAIEKGKKYSKEECKKLKDQRSIDFNDKHGNDRECAAEVDLMSALIKLRAKENHIAPQVLATNSDVKKLAHGITEGVSILKGWRKKLVGEELLKLLNGKISLKIKNGQLQVNKSN